MSMPADLEGLPIVGIWRAYKEWLRDYMPVVYANLAPGATAEQLDQVTAVVGHELPIDVRALLSVNNGQYETLVASMGAVPDSAQSAFQYTALLSTDCIIAEWRSWRETAAQVGTLPADYKDLGAVWEPDLERVKPLYANRHWVPLLVANLRAEYFGLDFDPGPEGSPGQIINFGRNEERHYVAAPDLTTWMQLVTEATMADGPSEPNPPVRPPECTDPDCEGCEGCEDEWYYWSDDFRGPWEILHRNRFPEHLPRPRVIGWTDWRAKEYSS